MAEESSDAITSTSPSASTTEPSAAELVGQKLLSAEEVYLYKIPPLKTSGGHRYVLVLVLVLVLVANI
jgi:hypothetical protein